ncbi:MAG: hypothetical protein K2O47_00935, partial [Muribaculaceae bacterium]|nr:hypothetical protein [Muribaculaceae bacterium]
NIIVNVVFIAFCYWILAVKNGFMLRWYDEMSLFEPTQLFFRQFLYYPGGLLRYAGAWLTQLMYHPWLGSTAIIILWLLLAFLIRKAFRLSCHAAPLAFLVPFALLVSVVQIDEAWISMKTTGYIFSNTLGFIFTAGAILLYKLNSHRPVIATIISCFCVICYFIAGYFALLGAVLCSISALRSAIKEKSYINYATILITVALLIVVPPLYYIYFQGNTVDNDYLYLKGLPDLMMESYDKYLWMPFIVSTAVFLLFSLINGRSLLKNNKVARWLSLAAFCCGIWWGCTSEHKSEQLRATVLMLQYLDKNDWEGILGIMSRIKEPPNYTMRMLKNLALANLWQPQEDMSAYTPKRTDARHSEPFTMTAFVNVPVYYNMARFNESYRWAMEHTVQYGKRVFFLKYMVKDALMNGEIRLARRYNEILRSTMFHREWAENMNRYIEDPALIAASPEFRNVLAVINTLKDNGK